MKNKNYIRFLNKIKVKSNFIECRRLTTCEFIFLYQQQYTKTYKNIYELINNGFVSQYYQLLDKRKLGYTPRNGYNYRVSIKNLKKNTRFYKYIQEKLKDKLFD